MEWIINHEKVDAGFSSKIILSDEAHFHLDGFVNRQNCRVWGLENLRVISEKQMYPQRVTVWCGFWAGIIEPYFFENEAVNGARYRDTITQFFLPKLDDINVADMWFQQDGAICHIANETIQSPHETFPDRVSNSLVSVIRIGPLDRAI